MLKFGEIIIDIFLITVAIFYIPSETSGLANGINLLNSVNKTQRFLHIFTGIIILIFLEIAIQLGYNYN